MVFNTFLHFKFNKKLMEEDQNRKNWQEKIHPVVSNAIKAISTPWHERVTINIQHSNTVLYWVNIYE